MAFDITFLALTFDFIGKVLIALTALFVHRKIIQEKKLDDIVLEDMKIEIGFGVLGIVFIVIAYILHLHILS